MQTDSFFAGVNRRVILGSPTLQTTSRRVKLPIRMPLTGESVVSMPSWLGEAYDAVSKFAREMSPEVDQVAEITLAFANDNGKAAGELFDHPDAKAPGSELKNFVVKRVDDPDGDPEVELQFNAYIPFSRDFWRWIGEMGGKEAHMAFPSTVGKAVSVVPPSDQPTLLEAVTDVEQEAFAGDSTPEDGPGSQQFEAEVRQSLGAPEPLSEAPRLVRTEPKPKKNGPKQLAEYHAKHLN